MKGWAGLREVRMLSVLAGERHPERGSTNQYMAANPECRTVIVAGTGTVQIEAGSPITLYGIAVGATDAVGSLVLAGGVNESGGAANWTIPAAKLTAGASLAVPGELYLSGLTLTVNASDGGKFKIFYRLT